MQIIIHSGSSVVDEFDGAVETPKVETEAFSAYDAFMDLESGQAHSKSKVWWHEHCETAVQWRPAWWWTTCAGVLGCSYPILTMEFSNRILPTVAGQCFSCMAFAFIVMMHIDDAFDMIISIRRERWSVLWQCVAFVLILGAHVVLSGLVGYLDPDKSTKEYTQIIITDMAFVAYSRWMRYADDASIKKITQAVKDSIKKDRETDDASIKNIAQAVEDSIRTNREMEKKRQADRAADEEKRQEDRRYYDQKFKMLADMINGKFAQSVDQSFDRVDTIPFDGEERPIATHEELHAEAVAMEQKIAAKTPVQSGPCVGQDLVVDIHAIDGHYGLRRRRDA